MALPVDRYTNSDYLNKNPTWDSEDAPWKANLILDILNEHNMHPSKVCEVGCGSGAVLSFLSHSLNDSDFIGYDISNSLHKFWDKLSGERIKFVFGDFNKINNEYYDLLLLLDVVEHIQDPFNFLTTIINSSKKFIFIFPLDLSAVSVLREVGLINQRRNVGHIHYFTKGIVLELLTETGFKIIAQKYSNASFNLPNMKLKTKIASIPRYLLSLINKDFSARLLGGQTLIVLAEKKGD
ncbi:methyltransferase domain-containing protein [Polynucleobacter paneuropaeus]|jgi:hypothetical protein|nr:methyltransferase domain-containing protein [Polynucleobacter paneuropaeus]MBT8611211.1 methyltransferase domain-containing protein [Polynucleobacter paneuropaeus]